MPELPEVEVTRQALEPHVLGKTVQKMVIRNPSLRWPIPDTLPQQLVGKRITNLVRRGKYLLWAVEGGAMIVHLGMTGCLRVLSEATRPEKHDHVDLVFTDQSVIRYTDPRRFGAVLWADAPVDEHRLIQSMGVEPLSADFSGEHLFTHALKRRCTTKQLLMDNHVVVGVGNIYACEALFMARVAPDLPANQLSQKQCQDLYQHICAVLRAAIKQGGTTFRDFQRPEGKPGYFKQRLMVYGRAGQDCRDCQGELAEMRIAGRSTVYCPSCQAILP